MTNKIIVLLLFLPSIVFGDWRSRTQMENYDGTKDKPCLSFVNNDSSGIYLSGSDSVGISVDSTEVIVFSKTEISISSSVQFYGQLEYKSFTLPLLEFYTIARDTIFPIPNEMGSTITIDSIKVLSTLDNQDLAVVECNEYGGNVELIESITVTTDPTGNEKYYYITITSIDHATIESKHRIGFVRSTIASEEILPTIYFHYNKQKKE